jgi:hypothetical protein
MQIANYADYCNECGNCDTFCPEYGGPFIEKPTFFGSLEQWRKHADHDGFCVQRGIAGRYHPSAECAERTRSRALSDRKVRPDTYTLQSCRCRTSTCDESGDAHAASRWPNRSIRTVATSICTRSIRSAYCCKAFDPTRINPANASM